MPKDTAPTVEPFKFMGSLIACEKDAEGNITKEFEAGKMVVYASQFGRVDEMVAEAWAEAEEGRGP